MSRTLILIIILAVVVLGGGAYFWLNKDTIVLPWATNSNTSVTTNTAISSGVTNTTTAAVNRPTEIKGDTAASGTLKVGDTVLTISSQQKQTTIDNETAEAGKTFLMIYFDAIDGSKLAAVDAGLTGVRVSDGKTSYPLAGLKVASNYIKGDRGYMRFSIPDAATKLHLELGTGEAVQTVPLP